MIPTKTYPLSAIMGGEISDKERITELADAFNKVCAENADFVVQSVTDENRIAELEKEKSRAVQGLVENAFERRIERTDLEAQLKHAEGHAAELEAEVMAWRERLALAVAALKSIDLHSWDRDTQKLAYETLAQIEEGK